MGINSFQRQLVSFTGIYRKLGFREDSIIIPIGIPIDSVWSLVDSLLWAGPYLGPYPGIVLHCAGNGLGTSGVHSGLDSWDCNCQPAKSRPQYSRTT